MREGMAPASLRSDAHVVHGRASREGGSGRDPRVPRSKGDHRWTCAHASLTWRGIGPRSAMRRPEFLAHRRSSALLTGAGAVGCRGRGGKGAGCRACTSGGYAAGRRGNSAGKLSHCRSLACRRSAFPRSQPLTANAASTTKPKPANDKWTVSMLCRSLISAAPPGAWSGRTGHDSPRWPGTRTTSARGHR